MSSMNGGLSRELLKWLQGLDLTYSVKNVKRDFSNGFLVAEIFSRYYVQDVEMHSYDNGQSLQKKLDNWGQLNKFFGKRNIKIDGDLINDVVHCKSTEAPAKLIQLVYTQLTGREIKSKPVAVDVIPQPAFSRPNAASIIGAQIKESELGTTLLDQNTAKARAQGLLDEHAATLRQERLAEPMRFQTSSGVNSNASYQRLTRGPAKPVPQEIESVQVRFQEVQVKPVERNISQLRASREQQIQSGLSFVSNPARVSAVDEGAPAAAPETNILQLLASYVQADGELMQELGLPEVSDDLFAKLTASLAKLPAALVCRFFSTIDEAEVAQAALSSPKQGWKFFAAFSAALGGAYSEDVFGVLIELLAKVGRSAVGLDPTLAESLMADFGQAKLLPLLRQGALRMRGALMAIFAFSAETPEAHLAILKSMQEAIADQQHFLYTITQTIPLEGAFSEELLDLYAYYCVVALGSTSSRLRAAAISMVPFIAAQSPDLVVQMLPRLEVALADPWWEIQVGLARLAAHLLCLHAGLEADVQAKLVAILSSVLRQRSSCVQSLVLPLAAPALKASPALVEAFVKSLLQLPAPHRAALIRPDATPAPLPQVAAASTHEVGCLPTLWPSLEVAQLLLESAKAKEQTNLEVAQAEIIAAILQGELFAAERDNWSSWLKANKDYLYVALCDEELCHLMTASLLALFRYLGEEVLPTFSTLFSLLRMLFPDGHPDCQAATISFLTSLIEQGEPFAGAVANLIANSEPAMRSAMGDVVALVGPLSN